MTGRHVFVGAANSAGQAALHEYFDATPVTGCPPPARRNP